MKTKFKYFLTLSLACVGLVSLLLSVSGNLSNNQQNEVGTYQIAVSSDQNALFRLNKLYNNQKSYVNLPIIQLFNF